MNQIDWSWLVVTLLWTGALGLALSTFGLAYNQASQAGEPVKKVLARFEYRLYLVVSLVLFCCGFILSAPSIELQIVVGIGTIWCIVEFIMDIKRVHP